VPAGLEVAVGSRLELQRHDGQRMPVSVVATDDDAIHLDANHPLAGEALTFELQLVAIV
jgi:peptidylprolyl isomerase